MIRAVDAKAVLVRSGPALGLLLVVIYATLVLGYFHDRFWHPRDDGYYAHIAERILDGEVLHRDVQGLHAGYVYFAHALALRLFGKDLVSLRYPLVVLGLLQSVLIFLLVVPRGPLTAAAASVSLTSLSYVQYLNPSSHWYCLFLVIAIVCVLSWIPRDHRWRLELLGFLVITLLLFRQLTGVIVAIGVLTYLLAEARRGGGGKDRWLARALISVMIAGLATYLIGKSDLLGWILFGLWPLGVLAWAWFTLAASNREVLRLLFRFGLGGVVAAAPLVLYHVLTGSLVDWFEDSVVSALAMTEFAYYREQSYGIYLLYGLRQLTRLDSVGGALNGLFWLLLVLAPMALGLQALRTLLRGGEAGPRLHPLPFLAVFYSVVSVHYQDAAYLFFTAGLTMPAVLWLAAGAAPWRSYAPAAIACLVSAVGIYYHAAQPFGRGLSGRLLGVRTQLVRSEGLERMSLWVSAAELADTRYLLDLIRRQVRPEETILAVPANAELYFLSGRKNPLKFSFIPFGILDENELQRSLQILEKEPPRLVFYVPRLPYNTAYTLKIMDFVRSRYDLLGKRAGFEIYRYRTGKD